MAVKRRKREAFIDRMLLVLACALMLAMIFGTMGCRTTKTAVSKSDSVRVEIRKERYDSIVYRDSIRFEMHLASPCDSTGKLKPINLKQRSGKSYASARSQGDTLVIDCGCEEAVQKLEREKQVLKEQLKTEYTKVEEAIKSKANWSLIWWVIGSAALNVILGYIIIRLIK